MKLDGRPGPPRPTPKFGPERKDTVMIFCVLYCNIGFLVSVPWGAESTTLNNLLATINVLSALLKRFKGHVCFVLNTLGVQ
jgi:hypothetical protein